MSNKENAIEFDTVLGGAYGNLNTCVGSSWNA